MRASVGRRHHDVLPANRELSGAEIELISIDNRERRLKAALERVSDDYDFRADRLSADAVAADAERAVRGARRRDSDAVRVLRTGLSDLVNTIKQVHANMNRDLKIIGLLRVMFDRASRAQSLRSTESALRRQGVRRGDSA